MKNRYAFVACEVLLLACALYATRLDLAYLFQRVAVPFQFDYEEGNILNAGLRITHGLTPYPDPHGFPNALNPYGPVPYLAVAAAIKLGGLGFLLPRLMIAASVIAIAFFIAFLLRREPATWVTAAAFGALWLSVPLVQDWMPIMRVDLLGLALALGGLYWFSRSPRQWIGAALLMTAAIFTKYSLLAAPAACFSWLLLERQFRRAAAFAAFLASASVVIFAATQWTSGGHFAFHMFGTHADPFSWPVFTGKFTSFLLAHAWLVALAAVYGVAQLLQRLGRNRLFENCHHEAASAAEGSALRPQRATSLPLLYLLFAAIGSVTAGKAGSNGNHFLELVAALVICAGLGFAALQRLRWRAVALAFTALAAALLGYFVLTAQPYTDPATKVGGCAAAYDFVRNDPSAQVLTENDAAVLFAGKPLFISNPFVYRFLVVNRGWSDEPIVDAVRARRFGLIVLAHDVALYRQYGSDRWSPAVVDAIAQNYAPVQTFGCVDARVMMKPAERPR